MNAAVVMPDCKLIAQEGMRMSGFGVDIQSRLDSIDELLKTAFQSKDKDIVQIVEIIKKIMPILKDIDLEVQQIKEKTDLFTLDEDDNLVIARSAEGQTDRT